MKIQERLINAQSVVEKAEIVWDHYLSRKLNNDFEPEWVHAGYELVQQIVVDGKSEDDKLALEIIQSHALPDGTTVSAFPGRPHSPQRIIHDGWKAGTPSWIFMGRNFSSESVIDCGKGIIAVQRTIPAEFYKLLDSNESPATLWMAYDRKAQMGLTALTSNVYGPAIYFKDLLSILPVQ